MERGSLFYALNMNDEKAKELSWSKRVDIISGTANGLSHRHHDCFSPIVHKDVTSNNILLNSELHVVVSDLEMLDFLILILQIRHYKLEHMGTLHQCPQGYKDFYAESIIGNTPMSVNSSVQGQNTKKSRHLGIIAFEDIIEGTQDFDIRYCIATGTNDYVYKAQISNGKIFALKKLH
ncbi:hypothetical protein Ahy_B06g084570 [Arachis hypogaea]|uniref:non-specific serine/threonine protein kinase n=1 Tax=Arachis hypogaea TaxID=3818 RepID=A0A444YSB1_ARAHY|nr:hypothetical protein Ahy_B06g084570 [Arachis hypogaea]